MNKKKVRGWPRQIRKLEKWKRQHLNPGLDRYGYDYVRVWLDPWCRLEKRNPPVWFRRLIVAAMLEIYESWHHQLQGRGEPFYLKIWLYEPRFIQSQVVAAVGEKVGYYENLFIAGDPTKGFPDQQFACDGMSLKRYDWRQYVDEEVMFEEAEELSAEEIAAITEVAGRVEETDEGDMLYAIKRGAVWVGSRKNV